MIQLVRIVPDHLRASISVYICFRYMGTIVWYGFLFFDHNFFLQLSENHQNHQKSSKSIEFHWNPSIQAWKTVDFPRKTVEFWIMVPLATLEASDDHQTLPTFLAHEYCRFWEYKVFLMSLSWFLSIFRFGRGWYPDLMQYSLTGWDSWSSTWENLGNFGFPTKFGWLVLREYLLPEKVSICFEMALFFLTQHGRWL